MSDRVQLHFPDYKELLQGCASYVEYEHRDAMYKLALRLVSQANWRCEELAEGLGDLLLTWNAAFYTRYNSFNFDDLEKFIHKNSDVLKQYSQRSILSYSDLDDPVTRKLFEELMEATKAVKKGAKTPVGAARPYTYWHRTSFQSGIQKSQTNMESIGLKDHRMRLNST